MSKMSDTDSDNQDKDMDVDKFDFLNSYFSEPVPEILPQCPSGMFQYSAVDPKEGNSGPNQTLFRVNPVGESDSASNFSQLSICIATPKFSGTTRSFLPGVNSCIKNPSQLISPQNNLRSRISYPSSSITTPGPSSSVLSDGKFSITTPTPNSCSSSDQGGIQTPSNAQIANYDSTKRASSTPLNVKKLLGGPGIINLHDQIRYPNSVMPVVNPEVCFTSPVLGFGIASYLGSDGIHTKIANIGSSVKNLNQVPAVHVCSNSQVPAPLQYCFLSPPGRFPRTSSYLDQLDYCFDSQLSPAPGPRQVCPDELNNNEAVKLKEEIEGYPSFVPLETHSTSPPVAVLLMPRLVPNSQKTLILKTGSVATKTLRSLKPRVKSVEQETKSSQTKRGNTNQKAVSADLSQSMFKSLNPPLVTRRSTGWMETNSKSSIGHPVFKTDFSPFYSNSVRKVSAAVQHGQNTIPLAKCRKNSADFWNVKLYVDGTEDLFIEKLKRFRGRRRNKHVGGLKVTETACDQFEPLKSIRIAPPIVSTRDKNVVNKSPSFVKIVKQRKPKKLKSMQNDKECKSSKTSSKPIPDCAKCEELLLQIKMIQDSSFEDVEINIDAGSELPSLCENCGSDIKQIIEGGTKVSKFLLKEKDDVTASDDGDIISIESIVNIDSNVQQISPFEEDNEIDTLVIDGDNSRGTQYSMETDSEDTTMSSPKMFTQTLNPICWSCKSTESLGSWHSHKWQHEKFLCSSCFSYYKDKNAESSRKEQKLVMKKKKNRGQGKKLCRSSKFVSKIMEVKNIQPEEQAVDTVKVETNLVPNYSLSLQNPPPGIHNLNSLTDIEAELDPISQALREMGDGILEINVTQTC